MDPPLKRESNVESVSRSLQWRHNWYDCVSNHQPHNCLLTGDVHVIHSFKRSRWTPLTKSVMWKRFQGHYSDVIMDAIASQITSLTIVSSTVYSVADQWKHQSSASLAFVWGIHRWPVNSPHKGPVTRNFTTSSWSSWVIISREYHEC